MAEGVYWKRHQAHADKLLAKGLIETGDLLGIPLYKLTNEGRKVIGAVE
jgi:predicted transcriptional regulator with HTH domain